MAAATPRSDESGPRDLNGRPVVRSTWQRVSDRLTGRRETSVPQVDDPTLRIVAESTDAAESSAGALDAADWHTSEQVVVRHLLALPADRIAEAVALAAQDGYAQVEAQPMSPTSALPPGHDLLALARTQLLDAMHLSQERSRMASLGSRHDGTALGWQVLQ